MSETRTPSGVISVRNRSDSSFNLVAEQKKFQQCQGPSAASFQSDTGFQLA